MFEVARTPVRPSGPRANPLAPDAQREVSAAAPVEQVVPGFASRARVVGDLVAREARSRELFPQRVSHLRLGVVIRHNDPTERTVAGHRHLFGEVYEREGIGGEVIRTEIDGSPRVIPYARHGMTGEAP